MTTTPTNQKTKPTRKTSKSKKSRKNYYFTSIHEEAIIEYVKTDSPRRKTELYVDFIQPAFNEMVDKIVFTYKFWLITILDKYDSSKGTKAFSYFSVITKNWFIHKVKQQQKRQRREINYSSIPKHYEEQFLSTNESYLSKRVEREFWTSFHREMQSWDVNLMKENDLKVYKAINILFESKEDIDIFNKKAIYLYLREITGLNTKQIVNSLKKFRKRYHNFKDDWNHGNL